MESTFSITYRTSLTALRRSCMRSHFFGRTPRRCVQSAALLTGVGFFRTPPAPIIHDGCSSTSASRSVRSRCTAFSAAIAATSGLSCGHRAQSFICASSFAARFVRMCLCATCRASSLSLWLVVSTSFRFLRCRLTSLLRLFVAALSSPRVPCFSRSLASASRSRGFPRTFSMELSAFTTPGMLSMTTTSAKAERAFRRRRTSIRIRLRAASSTALLVRS
mmetsp:Transcript_27684/g.60487  ORF Transcript_27684/g.60487 Transcript_27684/m.60487 type:complete len:220 (+) Transcript_27684:429-1088(+)